MDIYSAQKSMDRLLSYLKETEESKPYMYQKSKLRYRDLANTCLQVIQTISAILQEESLTTDQYEFDASGQGQVIVSMQQELSNLASFMHVDHPVSVVSDVHLTVKEKKEAIHKYATVLSTLASSSDVSYSTVVSDCCKLLWCWFDTRFLSASKCDPSFRYQVKKLPDWIYSIVIAYSESILEDRRKSFISEFYLWCRNLYTDKGSKYAVPYDVYQVYKTQSCVSLTSVVLWDVLLDAGLKEVCNNSKAPYVSDTAIYDMCSKFNPSELDDYKDFKKYPDLLLQCKLGDDY